MSEPYFILDASYEGSGKPCESDSDCYDIDILNKKETCNSSKFCSMSPRPRVQMLRPSCTTLATEPKFITKANFIYYKKYPSTKLILLIVFLTISLISTVTFIGLLIYKKIVSVSSIYSIFK
jgi:hypothetical protein